MDGFPFITKVLLWECFGERASADYYWQTFMLLLLLDKGKSKSVTI